MIPKSFLLALPLMCLPFAATAADMQAPPPPGNFCLDPTRGVESHWISGRDIMVRPQLGTPPRPEFRASLSVNCFNLDRSAAFHFHAFTHCLARGDSVSAQVLGGRPQRCTIMSIAPYTPDVPDKG